MIDLDGEKVEQFVNQFEVLGIAGNGATFDVLQQAEVSESNIVIAVTDSKELNILAGLMAEKMGAANTIVRVRNPDYLKQRSFMRDQLGLSMIINPELEAANEIRRILLFPAAFKIDTFVSGKIEPVKFCLTDRTKLNRLPLYR